MFVCLFVCLFVCCNAICNRTPGRAVSVLVCGHIRFKFEVKFIFMSVKCFTHLMQLFSYAAENKIVSSVSSHRNNDKLVKFLHFPFVL